MEFSAYITKKRNERKLSIRQLSLYSGVSPGYISQIESKKRGTPTPDIIRKLAKGLRIPYKQLMEAAGYGDEDINEGEQDSTEKLRDILVDYGMEDLFFENIDAWKKLTEEDIDILRRDIEYTLSKANRRESEGQ